jgi:hypothetical protein
MTLMLTRNDRPRRPLAVVFSDNSTGPADGDDTAALAAMLAAAEGWRFEVATAGPNGEMTVQAALQRPDLRLYAQPGASGDDEQAFRRQRADKAAIRRYVHGGGRYLGVCMGAFLAEPGFFNLFPGRVGEYYSSKGATVTSADPALVLIHWRGQPRLMYFQDGGYMVPKRKAPGVQVLARYPNGSIAAMVTRSGNGKVALCGPHPEAPPEWFHTEELAYTGPTQDLGDDLVATLMAP